MSWPLSQDYNEAIQSPKSNFADLDLRRGEATCNALGLPMPYSGNFADVYQVRCPDGKSWAVKCFTREAVGLRERYQEIAAHLRQAKLPFTVDFTYLEQGIRVAGKWFPALKMQWVEGLTLNQFVSRYLDKPAMLEALSQIWTRMAKFLRAAEVGHCDLQHGNVLLAPGASASSLALKLIDYDGMWVPALTGTKSGEVGHPSYQHPQRLREGTYSIEVDRFPLLLIATSLLALKAKGKGLWDKHDNGDNLLFKEADLREPLQSHLILDLIRIDDPSIKPMVEHLIKALRGGLETTPLLEELMPDARPAPVMPTRPSRLGQTAPAATSAVVTQAAQAAIAPVEAPPPTVDPMWAFDEPAPAPMEAGLSLLTRKRTARAKAGGVPVWAWTGSITLLVVALAATGATFLALQSDTDNPPAGSPVAQVKPSSPNAGKHPSPGSQDHPRGQQDQPSLWEDVNLKGAQNVDGVLRLPPGASVATKEQFSGPIEISVVAYTEKDNIRLYAFNGACVIFNWEGNPQELRVTRPDGNDGRESGSLATAKVRILQPFVWYTLRWRITTESMKVFVDDSLVFSELRRYDLSSKRPVVVGAVDSPVEVKSLKVKRL